MPLGTKDEYAVVIAGGGPTGLMLAGELKLAGVDVAIVERRPDQEVVGSRALGIHSRTIEVLDQRGIAGRFLKEGYTAQTAGFAEVHPLSIADFPTRHPYGLALRQKHIERLLLGWVEELGVPILRGREVVGFAQDAEGVDIALADGGTLRARYLVGADGGRSLVRKAAGIGFPGTEPTISNIIAEVQLRDEPPWGFRRDAQGVHGIGRHEDGGARIMLTEREVGSRDEAPTLAELSVALVHVFGTDFGVHSPTWISRFTDAARQAETYRQGRVLLAGDAAHVHYSAGGQGLNLGVQDAVNLGWKLAQVLNGFSPDTLLDTYQAERHPVAAWALQSTLAQVAFRRPDPQSQAAKAFMAELLHTDEGRKRIAGMLTGLDIRYDFGEGHPLLGRRVPDLDLETAGGRLRLYELLHHARPVLIGFGGALDLAPWADRVQSVTADYAGVWDLPVIGVVPAPSAVLVRPDGYVAWVGEGSDAGLREALTSWFGPPAA